jgi:hypothetical protein
MQSRLLHFEQPQVTLWFDLSSDAASLQAVTAVLILVLV